MDSIFFFRAQNEGKEREGLEAHPLSRRSSVLVVIVIRRLRLCHRVVARWEGIGHPIYFVDEDAGPVSVDENADDRFRSPISNLRFSSNQQPTSAADGSAWKWREDSRMRGGKDDESFLLTKRWPTSVALAFCLSMAIFSTYGEKNTNSYSVFGHWRRRSATEYDATWFEFPRPIQTASIQKRQETKDATVDFRRG